VIKYIRRGSEPLLLIALCENDIHEYRTKDAETVIPLDHGTFDIGARGSLHVLYSPTPNDLATAHTVVEGLDAEPSRFLVRRVGAKRFEVKVGLTESLLHDLRATGMLYMDVKQLPIDGAVDFRLVVVYARTNEENMQYIREIQRSGTVIVDTRKVRHG